MDKRRWTRRDALAAGTIVAGALGAGCLGSDSRPDPLVTHRTTDPGDTKVPSFQYDAGNTGTTATESLDGDVEQYWRYRIRRDTGGSVQPVLDKDALYVSGSDYVLSLDRTDGSRRWTKEVGDSPTGTPAVEDGVIYVPESGRGTNGVVAYRTEDQSFEWSALGETNVTGPIAVADGTVYALRSDDGTLYALDAASGDVRWTRKQTSEPRPPAATDGVAYVRTDPGDVIAIGPSS